MTNEEAIKVLKYNKPTTDPRQCGVELCEACDVAIQALETVIEHEKTYEWCTSCKEYDADSHCCHRWNKVIWQTNAELKCYYSETSQKRGGSNEERQI